MFELGTVAATLCPIVTAEVGSRSVAIYFIVAVVAMNDRTCEDVIKSIFMKVEMSLDIILYFVIL